MKNRIIYIGLVILSILYLFEVDFNSITYINYAAFVIIAVTLGSMIMSIYFTVRDKNKEKENKKIIKEAKKAEKENRQTEV